ncbi:PilN domain-containing protein [Pseudoduganella sp.]|uniref:PilN domain-containing protein n=1 Tax=Pseudoduganella sp. TaxID=1880898 RepID=UPI0035AF62F3
MMVLDRFLAPVPPAAKHMWFVAAICLACASFAAYKCWHAEKAVAHLVQVATALELPPPPKIELSKAELERNQEWNKLAVERRFNWYPVFKALERASSEDVELLAFDPDKANAQLVLRGEAKSVEAVVAYLARLSEQEAIGRVYLTRQRSTMRQSLKTTSFEIRASLIQ